MRISIGGRRPSPPAVRSSCKARAVLAKYGSVQGRLSGPDPRAMDPRTARSWRSGTFRLHPWLLPRHLDVQKRRVLLTTVHICIAGTALRDRPAERELDCQARVKLVKREDLLRRDTVE